MEKFKIYCQVWGMMGYRTAYLKDVDGKEKIFTDKKMAEDEALHLNATMGKNSATRFKYTVQELT
jgi:hypothetical protein